MPNGYDAGTFKAAFGEIGSDAYSRPNKILYDEKDPYILLPYAEVEFLKAEAIERGWYTGDAATEFKAGQSAAISQLGVDVGAPVIGASDIAAYQSMNAYPASGTFQAKFAQIENEMFILTASTLNGFEAWANYRRTGLPVLTPVNYPGNATGGTIMRRLRYPGGEAGVNPNYKTASDKMGGDSFTSRVWWDKQ